MSKSAYNYTQQKARVLEMMAEKAKVRPSSACSLYITFAPQSGLLPRRGQTTSYGLLNVQWESGATGSCRVKWKCRESRKRRESEREAEQQKWTHSKDQLSAQNLFIHISCKLRRYVYTNCELYRRCLFRIMQSSFS